MVDLREEIAKIEREMEDLLPDTYMSDLANEKYGELKQELRELKKLLRDEKKGY